MPADVHGIDVVERYFDRRARRQYFRGRSFIHADSPPPTSSTRSQAAIRAVNARRSLSSARSSSTNGDPAVTLSTNASNGGGMGVVLLMRRRKRAACTLASVWAAPTCSVSSRIRRQSRAAMVPMLTLSWLCASVERENTLAGMVSLSASAVHADDDICTALKP